MEVASCQIEANDVLGGSGGRSIALTRAVDGIRVAESRAYARFNTDDRTSAEGLYWPTVAAAVVSAARSLRDRLANATDLAAYRAKLPMEAQDEGTVVIHHASGIIPEAGCIDCGTDSGRWTRTRRADRGPDRQADVDGD